MDPAVLQAFQHLKDKNTDIFEKARLLDALKKHRQVPLKDISAGSGLKPSYLCHIERLNKLPSIVVDGYYAKSISLSHLFIISRLKNEQQIAQAYERILKDSLTVFATEDLVRQMLYSVKNEGNFLTPQERDELIAQANSKNIKVKVIQTRTRGKIIIEFGGSLARTSQMLRTLITFLKSWLNQS